jgi:hypothetical protein
LVILASPIYFGDVTSQTKGLIDRFFCYHASDFRTSDDPSRLGPGKKMILILTQGNPDPTTFEDIAVKYARIFGHLGFQHVHTLRAVVVSADCDVFAQEGFGEAYTIRAARAGPDSVVRTQGPLTQLIRQTACSVMSPSP